MNMMRIGKRSDRSEQRKREGLSKIKRNRAGAEGDDAQHVEGRKKREQREHENTRTGQRSR